MDADDGGGGPASPVCRRWPTRLAKESLNRGMDIANIKDASQADVYRFAALSQTEDALEAHRAWRERRPPVVRGQ